MPRWWYVRRSSRLVAEGVATLGLIAFLTLNWTSTWFGLLSAVLCFGFAAVAAAHARLWILCVSVLTLMLISTSIALLVLALSGTTWAPSLG
jgi:hypothetical protein